jgi:transposase
LPHAIERLSGRLSEALRPDERQLLVAVAENIPQREIAEWLGVSYAVARKRLERLRARLTEVAMQYANSLEPDDARELQRFFHRCRARIGAHTIGAVAPTGQTTAEPVEPPPCEVHAPPRHPRISS